MAWQAQIFSFSAIKVLKKRPVVIVHQGPEKALLPEFQMLRQKGCPVIEAPSFVRHPTGLYFPRNELGSLLVAASITNWATEHILFCESDMLFANVPHYQAGLWGEYYDYMHYHEDRIKAVAQKFGVEHLIESLNGRSKIGVPYLIPVQYLGLIASRWIEVMDSFSSVQWIDIMYAFGLSLAIDGLEPKTTHMIDTNLRPNQPLSGEIIHYCYWDSVWDKRHFLSRSPFDIPDHELPTAEAGTIMAEMMNQLVEAKQFFRA